MITNKNVDFLTQYGSKEHLDKILGDPRTSTYAAMNNPYLDHSHIQKLIDMNHESLHEITYHPHLFDKATDDQITQLSKSKDKDVRTDLSSSYTHLKPHHIENLLNGMKDDDHFNSIFVKNLGMAKNATPEQFDRMVNMNNLHMNQSLSANKNLPEKHIQKFVNSSITLNRINIANHPKLKPEHVEQLAKDENEFVRSKIAGRRDLPDHIKEKLRNDPKLSVSMSVGK